MMIDVSSWAWPQITTLALTGLGIGVSLAKHGQPSIESFWSHMVAVAISYALLICGGFFR